MRFGFGDGRAWGYGIAFALVGWIGSALTGAQSSLAPSLCAGGTDPARTQPGPAMLGALIGGLRVPLGDLIWLRGNRDWVREDYLGVLESLSWVYWLRPEAVHFRIEGARTIAYDFPRWESARTVGEAEFWVDEALEHLDRAMDEIGRNGYLLATRGEILLRGKSDPLAAAAHYREAAKTPEAAFFFTEAADYLESLATPESSTTPDDPKN